MAQHSTAQHMAQHSMAQNSTWHSTAHGTAQHGTAQHGTAHGTAQYGAAQHMAQHSTAHGTAKHGTAQHGTAEHSAWHSTAHGTAQHSAWHSRPQQGTQPVFLGSLGFLQLQVQPSLERQMIEMHGFTPCLWLCVAASCSQTQWHPATALPLPWSQICLGPGPRACSRLRDCA